MKISRLLTAALLFVAVAAASAAEFSADQKAAADRLLQQTAANVHLPSLVALVDRGGSTVYQSALGSADLEHGVPANLETPYGIGSITKSFTALAVLELVAEGKLSLDGKVRELLPGYEGPAADVTVQQLLTHTSGIPNYTSEIPGIRKGLERSAYSREQMVAFFRQAPLHFPPGSMFSYTNSGYYLLGLIIEAASGQDYYAYLQEHVFKPLGMSHTWRGDDSQIVPGRARGYTLGEQGFSNAPPWYYLVPFSAGSLVSTAGDLVRYRRGVLRSDALPPRVRELALQTTTLSGGEKNAYALGGLILSDLQGHRKIAHDGDIWGYTSTHAYYPDDDLTIVLLTNRQVDAPALSSIETKLARISLGIPPPVVKDLVLEARDLDRYAGNFDMHPFLVGFKTIGFAGRDGKLFMRFGGLEAEGPMIPLLAQGNGLFRASFDDEWVFEFGPATGKKPADRLESHYRGGTLLAQRRHEQAGK